MWGVIFILAPTVLCPLTAPAPPPNTQEVGAFNCDASGHMHKYTHTQSQADNDTRRLWDKDRSAS